MSRAFVFPGQGSQAIGMGKELAEAEPVARAVFDEVDQALGQNLSGLMFDGDMDVLTLTENAQPALMAVSLAVIRVLENKVGKQIDGLAAYVAGHSLGEYSALAAAGALGLSDTARLLKRRGQAMQRAVPVGEGAMAAILGLDLDAVKEITADAADGEVCAAANDNAPGQVVISGARSAVERAVALSSERGGRRSVLLPVSAPFHCSLMQPAADEMAEALAGIDIVKPAVPLVCNVTAQAIDDPNDIRRLLVEQVTGMVRWRESVAAMRDYGVDTFAEVGAGKVLSGLVRRIDRDLASVAINGSADIAAFVDSQS
ncbi:MAG: ACP S-malonyltransferase [Pseudomonadota bacterium]